MGADLIGFLCKGPLKIKKADIKKAEKRAADIIIFAAKVYELLKKDDKTEEDEKFLDTCLTCTPLSGFNDQEQHDNIYDCEQYLENIAASTAKDEVNNFIAWWETGDGRDTMSRPDPDDRKQQIVFCGETTWGDAPEGLGHTTMNRAYWFDIPQNLGIR
jgi:hypothetical protein